MFPFVDSTDYNLISYVKNFCHNLTNKPNLTKETIEKQLSLEIWKFQKTQ